ncbi:MAG: 50S ribosomal protein L15 [Anaerolineae bacterium]|nr:50S ribosomal protein L15 [Anaerolineae bacterium]
MNINDLKPNPGAKKNRKRVGHGPSAGQGKTGGRGTKGQGSRSGEGGNMYRQGGNLPFYRRLPFRRGEGFTPPNAVEYSEVNLDQLARFEAGAEITPAVLAEANLVKKATAPVVVMGRGEISVALKVRVQRVTESAKSKIEAAGGSVEIVELTQGAN